MNDEKQTENLSEHGGSYTLNEKGERVLVERGVTVPKVNGAPPRDGDPPEVAPEDAKPVTRSRRGLSEPSVDAPQQ